MATTRGKIRIKMSRHTRQSPPIYFIASDDCSNERICDRFDLFMTGGRVSSNITLPCRVVAKLNHMVGICQAPGATSCVSYLAIDNLLFACAVDEP